MLIFGASRYGELPYGWDNAQPQPPVVTPAPYGAVPYGQAPSQLLPSYSLSLSGLASHYAGFSAAAAGVRRQAPFECVAVGAHAYLVSWSGNSAGLARSGLLQFSAQSHGQCTVVARFEVASVGLHDRYGSFYGARAGQYTLSPQVWLCTAAGSHTQGYDAYGQKAAGQHRFLLAYAQPFAGLGRIADLSLDRFELYRAIDGAAFDWGTPWATFSALPHTTPTLTPGHNYAFVLRRRNRYNLVSRNLDTWTVSVAAGGDATLALPAAPSSIAAAPAAGGAVRVTAEYALAADPNPADVWHVYLAVGADPDPVTATPVIIAMGAGPLERLDYTSGPYSDAQDVRVLVRTAYTGAESANADVYSVLTETDGPPAPSGLVLFGRVAAQRQ